MAYDYNFIVSTFEKQFNQTSLFQWRCYTFFCVKSKMYSHIICVDPNGTVVDRKSIFEDHRNIYRKHHKVRGILVEVRSHSEYTKIVDKPTSKAIFESLYSTYEGIQQIKEVKTNMLVQHYDLFIMKEDEDNKTMSSRFQTLVSGLQVLTKSYTTPDHVKKILRSLSAKWSPKVTSIQEAKYLNRLSLENLISSLKSLKVTKIQEGD